MDSKNNTELQRLRRELKEKADQCRKDKEKKQPPKKAVAKVIAR